MTMSPLEMLGRFTDLWAAERTALNLMCFGLQDGVSGGPTTLSTEHDGPMPRLALDQLPRSSTNSHSEDHQDLSPSNPSGHGPPRMSAHSPTQFPPQPPTSHPHDDASDAIVEGFGLPNQAGWPLRPPSEAPSDAFTDTPRQMPAGKAEQEPSHPKTPVSTLYEKILAQQQSSGALRRRSSSSGSKPDQRSANEPGSALQKGVPDPSDWQREALPPTEGKTHDMLHAKGVPDPSDWQREAIPPSVGKTHDMMHAKGVPDSSERLHEDASSRGGTGHGTTHAKGVPDPADWNRQGPNGNDKSHLAQIQSRVSTELHADIEAQGQPEGEAAKAEASGDENLDIKAHGDENLDVKAHGAGPAGAKKPQKYSYLQQIGVIGKGPPPSTGEHAWGRQQLKPSPRRPSLPGDPGNTMLKN